MTSGISDRTGPDSTKVGAWLFKHRTSIPVPVVLALFIIPPDSVSLLPVIVGVTLTALGELLRLWAVHHIGVISRTRSDRLGPLVASGPFRFCRNPLYVGNMAIWVGFTLAARLVWMAPLVFGLLLAEYHAIVRWEEALLESRLGQAYRDYAARVPRWIPTLGPGVPTGKAESDSGGPDSMRSGQPAGARFSWSDTLFSERGTLVAIAAGYVLLCLRV
jgi:protein-S-isoprenylcysteine O-methyltransferase Ste14